MADIDASNPSDDAIVSTFPSNERDSRAAVVTVIGEEHSATTGRHKIPRGTTVVRDAVTDWEQGSLYVNTTTGSIQHQEASSSPFDWKDVSFPAGTKMIFYQASAPTGWTQDVSLNDVMVAIVSGAGGGTSGNWTMSGLAVDGHSLTEAELASHYHFMFASSGDTGTANVTADAQVPQQRANNGSLTTSEHRYSMGTSATAATLGRSGTSGSGTAHTHGLTNTSWRPSSIESIVASKDAL